MVTCEKCPVGYTGPQCNQCMRRYFRNFQGRCQECHCNDREIASAMPYCSDKDGQYSRCIVPVFLFCSFWRFGPTLTSDKSHVIMVSAIVLMPHTKQWGKTWNLASVTQSSRIKLYAVARLSYQVSDLCAPKRFGPFNEIFTPRICRSMPCLNAFSVHGL